MHLQSDKPFIYGIYKKSNETLFAGHDLVSRTDDFIMVEISQLKAFCPCGFSEPDITIPSFLIINSA